MIVCRARLELSLLVPGSGKERDASGDQNGEVLWRRDQFDRRIEREAESYQLVWMCLCGCGCGCALVLWPDDMTKVLPV